jgi:hypothetical protein
MDGGLLLKKVRSIILERLQSVSIHESNKKCYETCEKNVEKNNLQNEVNMKNEFVPHKTTLSISHWMQVVFCMKVSRLKYRGLHRIFCEICSVAVFFEEFTFF